jgi:hypothetical protein
MSISLRTQTVITLVITVLSIGCHSKNNKPKPKPPIEETKAQKQKLDELQEEINEPEKEIKEKIVPDNLSPDGENHPNKTNSTNGTETIDLKSIEDSKHTIELAFNTNYIGYSLAGESLDKYDWKITNVNNEPVKFYGQNSNRVMLTELPEINNDSYEITVTCTSDSPHSVTTKTFLIKPIYVERLKIQKAVNEARALWSTNSILGKLPSKVTEDQVAKLKLSQKWAQKAIEHPNLLASVTLIGGTIEDEQFKKEHPRYPLGSTTLKTLQDLLCKEFVIFNKNIKDLLVIHASPCKNNSLLFDALVNTIDLGALNNADVLKQFALELQKCVSSDAYNELNNSGFLSRVSEWRNEANRYGLPLDDLYYSVIIAATLNGYCRYS